MASTEETAFDDDGFTHADAVLADGETERNQAVLDSNQPITDRNQAVLDPNQPVPDPTPDVTPKEPKEKAGGEDKKDSGNGAHNLKSTLFISGAVVAILGAIFTIAKKIKQA